MNLSTMILSPIAGGAIGYFTNWLAIKMLFRPHSEVYFLGVRLPFTPGLIPKERYKLADKVSEAISDHLLTKEVIVENLISDDVINEVNRKLIEFEARFANDEHTVNDYVCKYFGDNVSDNVSDIVAESIAEAERRIASVLEKQLGEENIHRIAEYFVREFGDMLSKYPIRAEAEKAAERLCLYDKYEGFMSKNIQEFLRNLKDEERTLREIIPAGSDVSAPVKVFVNDKLPLVSSFIQDVLEKNPDLDERLEFLVEKVINENVSRLALMFINKENVYTSIKNGVISYFEDPDNQAELGLKLSALIDKILDKPIKDIEGIEEFIEIASDKLKELGEKDFNRRLYNKLWDGAFTLIEKGGAGFSRIEEKAEEILFRGMTEWVSKNGERMCEKAAEFIVNYVLNLRADKIISSFIRSERDRILGLVKPLAQRAAVYASDILDIGKIAKEQINAMDLEKGEEIVLSVVKRELRAITLVGGVLGFIIGFVPVVLELFM